MLAFMLIPINSGTIVAVIIEASSTDRKSHTRRLDISKMAASEIRSYPRSMRMSRCTHAHRSYTVHHCWSCCVVGILEESRLAICGKAARPCATRPHNRPLSLVIVTWETIRKIQQILHLRFFNMQILIRKNSVYFFFYEKFSLYVVTSEKVYM